MKTEKLHFISRKNTNQNIRERGYNITKDVRVFVENSGCGGCGSGMFIDLAYNIRDILKTGKGVALNGYMITPEVFNRPANSLNMSGNSYATQKELDYFMNTRYFASGLIIAITYFIISPFGILFPILFYLKLLFLIKGSIIIMSILSPMVI